MAKIKLVKKERQRGVGVYVSNRVYESWLNDLTVKDLVLALSPPSEMELNSVVAGSRSNYSVVVMKMPNWWIQWYRSLDIENKFKFAEVVEKRLRNMGLLKI